MDFAAVSGQCHRRFDMHNTAEPALDDSALQVLISSTRWKTGAGNRKTAKKGLSVPFYLRVVRGNRVPIAAVVVVDLRLKFVRAECTLSLNERRCQRRFPKYWVRVAFTEKRNQKSRRPEPMLPILPNPWPS